MTKEKIDRIWEKMRREIEESYPDFTQYSELYEKLVKTIQNENYEKVSKKRMD